MSVPSSLLIFSASNGTLTGSFFLLYTSTIPPTTSPAPISSISWHARSMAASALFGSRPFSNLPDASVRSPIFLLDLRMLVPSKQAASNNIVWTSSVIIEFSPPMIPAIPMDFLPSQIISTDSSISLSCPSRVVNFSPFSAVRTTISFPSIVSRSYACIGCPYSSIT